jgi:hypothetical protein
MSDQALNFSPSTSSATAVVPASGVSEWVTAIAAGDLEVSDLAGDETVSQTPDKVYTNRGSKSLIRTNYEGTTLRVRLRYYDDGVAYGDAPPLTIRVFGTANSNAWTALRNLNGDASVPIPIDPPYTDHPGSDTHATVPGGEGTNHLVNQPDNNAHSWDCDGCNKFIIAVERSFATDGAHPEVAYLEAKIV